MFLIWHEILPLLSSLVWYHSKVSTQKHVSHSATDTSQAPSISLCFIFEMVSLKNGKVCYFNAAEFGTKEPKSID